MTHLQIDTSTDCFDFASEQKDVLKKPHVANHLLFQLMVMFLTQRPYLSFANGDGLDKKSWLKRRTCFEIEILRRGVHLARANQK